MNKDELPWWYEEKDNWRHNIPPTWRYTNLTNMPLEDKMKCGLLYQEEWQRSGDPTCAYCKTCTVYKTCLFNNMHSQNNCATHQIECGIIHPDPTDPQRLLSEFA